MGYEVIGRKFSANKEWTGLSYFQDIMSEDEFENNLNMLVPRLISNKGSRYHRKLISTTPRNLVTRSYSVDVVKYEEGMEKFFSPWYIRDHAKLNTHLRADFIIFNEKDNLACMCLNSGLCPVMIFQDSAGNKCIGSLQYGWFDFAINNKLDEIASAFESIMQHLTGDIEFRLLIGPDSYMFKDKPRDFTLDGQIFEIVDMLGIRRDPNAIPIVPSNEGDNFFNAENEGENVTILY